MLTPFLDKRDKGVIILSPISLLCGLAMPIWMSSLFDSDCGSCDEFWLWSGVITVGIGDSFAALIGRRWGRYYWNWRVKGRTLEGSLGCFLSQLVMCYVVFRWLQIPLFGIFAQRVFLAVVVTTLVEAHTDQLDNFVLPLVFSSFR